MKVTLESTTKIVTLNGIECRLWQGTTERGVPCHAYIPRIAAANEQDTSEFDAELDPAHGSAPGTGSYSVADALVSVPLSQMKRPPEPPTLAMRLRDLQTGLRAHIKNAEREGLEAWSKGPGHYLGIKEVLRELLHSLRQHDRQLGELRDTVEASGNGVILERTEMGKRNA